MQIGRQQIFTNHKEITSENIADVMRESMSIHDKNVNRMNFLLEYEAGKQPIVRKQKKKYRPDIDCKCVDNVANEVSDFKISYGWNNLITLVMREVMADKNNAEAVALLNKFYEIAGYEAIQQALARFVEICGIGYTYIDINTEYEDGESPFVATFLDPRCTFLVYSNYYIDNRPIMAVSYSCDSKGTKQYTCFTKNRRYELNNLYEHISGSDQENPLGIIPIIEWVRYYDRMGCFERQIPEMDNLNLLVSDFTNDVEQNTQVIWHTVDVEFPKVVTTNSDGTETEETRKPQSNEWLQTYSTADGKTPKIAPLVVNYDYPGMLQNIIARRSLILQKCNVPSRNDNSGGSTGIAMSDATGWTQAEVEAVRQDQVKSACKIQEVKVVLKAIAKCSGFPKENPLLRLKASDVKASIKRQKTYEMTTKINAYATGVSHGINYKDMLNAINLFDDPQQVAKNSEETTKAYLESVFKANTNEPVGGVDEKKPNADRLEQDKSDQMNNSPMMN